MDSKTSAILQSSAIPQFSAIPQSSAILQSLAIPQSSTITIAALRKTSETAHLSFTLIKQSNNSSEDDKKKKEELIKNLNETRNNFIEKWKQRPSFNFIKSLIVIRPISSTASTIIPNNRKNEDNLSDVSLAAFGLFHAMIILRSSESEYLLDRCVEGIRLKKIEEDDESLAYLLKCFEHKQPMSLVIFGNYDTIISSHQLIEWIEQEAQLEYNLFKKNCTHFAWNFALKFAKNEKKLSFSCFLTTIKKKFGELFEKIKKNANNPHENRTELQNILPILNPNSAT